ncbi:Uncharacterized protein APZ42_034560 [Daphnia magna]|uniref:Uncharacterized protein n=1 Tax=Daphnia magna TaxID=35525 RepID=A0A164K1G1_9CRUS|nr:Uncharacterized protein APZ42_034560 [Daphnia magna]
MNEPIDVFDGDCFIGWLWDSTMAVANVRPFRPFGTPPPFDMDDYKDSFEIWQAQWKIFLELSTIDTALDAAERPRYKANVLKSCMSKSTLTALLTFGMSAADLQDPVAIITALKDRCNAGRNCHVWRQQFSSRVQREKEAIDDWLCDLRSISSKCEFGTDCCAACEPTRILGQLVFGVCSDDDRRKLLELGPTLKLDDALKTLRLTEATRKQSANLKGGDASSIFRMSQSTYKKNKNSNHQKKVSFDTKTDTPSPATKHGGALKVGHFLHVCRDKGKKKKSGDVRSISVHSVTVGAVTVAELVDISVAPKGPSASAAQVLFLPDTGAELDAIPRETFRRVFKGVKLVPAASPETATGSPIMNFGTFSATLNWNADDDERRPITTTVHVLQDLKQAELSKSSQKKLGMWPESYPHARLSTLTSSAFTDVGTDSSPIPSLLFPHLLSRPMSAPMTVASLEPGITGERKAADLKNFLTNFRLIFDGVCRPMKVPPCHFELKADATPVSMRGSRPSTHSKATIKFHWTMNHPLSRLSRHHLAGSITSDSPWASLTPVTTLADEFPTCSTTSQTHVVEDILIFSFSYEEHMETVRQVFARAKEHGISLNPRKVVFAESSAPFGGFIVDAEGFRPDPALLSAISQFPTPLNITDLRAVFSLCQQLGNVSHDISSALGPLSPLLKKGLIFEWTSTHNEVFTAARTALSAHHSLTFYDPALPTSLPVDASRPHGLGFLLKQKGTDAQWKVVQAGSRFLSSAESRYAMIELECLATAWGMHKCRQFLEGLPSFELITDHKPLIPILNSYALDKLDSPRLLRLRLKMQRYAFTARWIPGKENQDSDALSRAPIAAATSQDELSEGASFAPPRIALLCAIDGSDPKVIEPVLEKCNLSLALRHFWRIRHHLAIDEEDGMIVMGARVVIPKALQRDLLRDLLKMHQPRHHQTATMGTTVRLLAQHACRNLGPNRDYLVKTPAGRVFRRNRRFLRRRVPVMPAAVVPPTAPAPPAPPAIPGQAVAPCPALDPAPVDQASSLTFMTSRLPRDEWKNTVDILNVVRDTRGSVVKVVHDENNEVAQILIQTKGQCELFKKFGDLVEIDGTYRVTKTSMPLYTILVEDNFGIDRSICYIFWREETTISINTSLQLFAEVLVLIFKRKRLKIQP